MTDYDKSADALIALGLLEHAIRQGDLDAARSHSQTLNAATAAGGRLTDDGIDRLLQVVHALGEMAKGMTPNRPQTLDDLQPTILRAVTDLGERMEAHTMEPTSQDRDANALTTLDRLEDAITLADLDSAKEHSAALHAAVSAGAVLDDAACHRLERAIRTLEAMKQGLIDSLNSSLRPILVQRAQEKTLLEKGCLIANEKYDEDGTATDARMERERREGGDR